MATRTSSTSEVASLGLSTSSYADWPATLAVPLVVTSVLGVIAASALSAAACGEVGTLVVPGISGVVLLWPAVVRVGKT